MLAPQGHLIVLFSNYAKCRGLVERSPLERFAASEGLELRSVQRRVVEDRRRHRQTRRDKAWAPRHESETRGIYKRCTRYILLYYNII